jgi:ribosome-associated protein
VADDIRVNDRITIPGTEPTLRASRSSGPGGQHVNTADTRIQLRWSLRDSVALNEADRRLAEQRLASRLNRDGELILECDAHRSQRRNRQECLERLAEILRAALHRDPPRKKTRPSGTAREKRLWDKKQRGTTKKLRREPTGDD